MQIIDPLAPFRALIPDDTYKSDDYLRIDRNRDSLVLLLAVQTRSPSLQSIPFNRTRQKSRVENRPIGVSPTHNVHVSDLRCVVPCGFAQKNPSSVRFQRHIPSSQFGCAR
jgi:hypothetical protein